MTRMGELAKGFRAAIAAAAAAALFLSHAQAAAADAATEIRRALTSLPYYGVFDFLAYSVDRGTVTLVGYAYRRDLQKEAEAIVKRVAGVDEVLNKIEVLPASLNDDRIRWATFYNIYTDDFLSRYVPGGAMAARYDAIQFARFPGMQPLGTYPIHIIVKGGRTTLLGSVDADADKTLAGVRALEVGQVFSVANELMVHTREVAARGPRHRRSNRGRRTGRSPKRPVLKRARPSVPPPASSCRQGQAATRLLS